MKVALVTGASSGIGKAVAALFAGAGYQVFALGRNEARLGELAKAFPGTIHTLARDLEDSDACRDVVALCAERFGRIDVLVNGAGVIKRADVLQTSDDDWRQIMGLNLDVPFYLSRAALPHLKAVRGRIINIASDWGLRGGEQAAAYCASKGGLVLLTKAMARDHAPDGVTVNAVCPGDVMTPMLEKEARDQGLAYKDALDRWHKESPTGRLTEPEEVASLVLYLASDAAAQITGVALVIDGGGSA